MSDKQIKYITPIGLKNSLQSFLDKLKNWLPIKKNKESVIITTPEYKNAVEIKSDGTIYIVGTNNDQISLQERINRGTEIVDTYLIALEYLEDYKNLGKLIYVLNDMTDDDGKVEYSSGLYVVLKNITTQKLILSKLGTTTHSEKDLGERVDALEQFVKTPININDINNFF
jgi:hypothetical protein